MTYWQTTYMVRYWKGKLVEYFALGVPAYRLRFHVPYSLPVIERFYRVIRTALYQAAIQEESLKGTFEMDETMFGGRRPGKRGWGAQGKVIVFGIYQRNGHVLTFPIPSRGKPTIMPIVKTHTKSGSLYYTDDWHAYASLAVRGNHVIVEKDKGVPKGRDHLNGIEGFWSYAKHFLYHYRGVPRVYFHLYLKEVEFRFNNRNTNLLPIIIC